MTTGVALVGAAVVVANPLVTKPHDVSVPSVRLSAGAGAAHGIVDKALVDAIAVKADDSTSPGAVLKQLFASLAADAALFGGKAVSEVIPHDPAVTPPLDQTDAAASPNPAAAAAPADMNALADLMQPVLQAPAAAASQIGPELQQALTVVTADTGYLGRQVVVAAIAAAGLTVTEPAVITQVVTALASGDVTGAVNKVIAAAEAPLRPASIILDAVRTVATGHAVNLESGAAALTAAIAGPRHAPTLTAVPGSRGVSRAALHTADPQDSSGAGVSVAAVTPNGATDLSDGNKVTPRQLATTQTQTHPNFAVGEQIRTAFANLGAVVRKLAGLPPKDTTPAGSNATN